MNFETKFNFNKGRGIIVQVAWAQPKADSYCKLDTDITSEVVLDLLRAKLPAN